SEGAGVICCSALLTTTMGQMKNVVDLCISAGIRDKVKIMVGGAPITDEFCKEIGADAYTADAASCAEVARSFFG
ncbi:MAG: cobalamin-dependent protein, partial [Clostridiales bacterium]|nr:cobalamin-dependent protein [Clostridiales bacterium]